MAPKFPTFPLTSRNYLLYSLQAVFPAVLVAFQGFPIRVTLPESILTTIFRVLPCFTRNRRRITLLEWILSIRRRMLTLSDHREPKGSCLILARR